MGDKDHDDDDRNDKTKKEKPNLEKDASAAARQFSSLAQMGTRLSNWPSRPVPLTVSREKARVRAPDSSSDWAMPRALPAQSPWGKRALSAWRAAVEPTLARAVPYTDLTPPTTREV